MLVKKVAFDNKDALQLFEGLSTVLEKITGSTGKASFNTDDMKDDRAVVAVAYEDDVACGCGCLRPLSRETGEIKRVFAKVGKKGVGGEILAFLEKRAKDLDYKKLILETRKVNINAVHFYLNHGYEVCENYGKYKGRDEAICFNKNL